MGFSLSIKGEVDEIQLNKESIVDVRYISETPDDSKVWLFKK